MDLEKQVNELDIRMKQVEKEFDDIRSTLRRIENAITGDSHYGVVGYRERIKDNTARIENLTDFKKKVTYYALGGAAVGTALGWIVVNVILNFV